VTGSATTGKPGIQRDEPLQRVMWARPRGARDAGAAKVTDGLSASTFLSGRNAPFCPAHVLAVEPFKRQKRKSHGSDDGAFSWFFAFSWGVYA
jgi:hypothetical protein